MFLIMKEKDFASCVNENTPYTKGDCFDDAIEPFESNSVRLIHWFKDNQMKAKKEKYHFVVSGKCDKTVNVGDVEIRSRYCEKLLVVKTDSILNFEYYLSTILTKASR